MTVRVSRRAVVAVLVALATIAVVSYRHVTSGPSDTRPVTLPATFAGLTTSTFSNEGVPESISEDLGGAPTALTTYGAPGTTIVNVVAARADMSDRVDLRYLGDDGRLIGGTRCTTNVVLRELDEGVDSPGSPMTGKLLCWRTSDELSVSAFVLSRPPAAEDVAAAVDALWSTVG